ncbi:uncharacterized protein LOC112177876 [Rosa chinensis]|uniref:uncharacterized protein LOC112177876 n=1 Tax=Rosa chinensis TaxID=74649 RepID=UPI000D08A9CF|nr:uncharacterized protein LOC112177876 [Rosa chinensis]
MYFDGSSAEFSAGAGVVVETHEGQKFQFAFQLHFTCMNNQAECEALIVGLEILQELVARFAVQNEMVADDYTQEMIQELEELDQERMDTYNRMEAQKKAVARAYNKRLKSKSFAEEDLVWKAVLPIGTKDRRFGKWSPRWEGLFIIDQVLGKGAYQLRDQDGELHAMPINGQFLKKYYPTTWEMRVQEL